MDKLKNALRKMERYRKQAIKDNNLSEREDCIIKMCESFVAFELGCTTRDEWKNLIAK